MQHTFRAVLVLLFLLAVLPPPSVPACTSFFLTDKNAKIFGFNFDWSMGHGYLIVNKRHVHKTAMPGYGTDPGPWAAWTSQFGSLTFNQYGREMPMGGINEAGLVVHMMMLRSTQYPSRDKRPAIKDLQWIQYQLDNFSTVNEVLTAVPKLRITIEEPGLHYLVADRMGNCAAVEFIEGQLVTHAGKVLPVNVLTNNTYADSAKHLRKHHGFGFEWPIPSGPGSLDRFVRTAHLLQQYDSEQAVDPVEYGFEVLASVRQRSTQWSIVYYMQQGRVYFRTFANLRTRFANMADFNFECADPVRVLSLTDNLKGDVSRQLSVYTPLVNRDMINIAFKGTYFFEFTPHTLVEKRVRYPESTTCMK